MSTLVSPKSATFSLYRSCRRQVRLLPSEYLRQFFRLKLADDVRTVLRREKKPALQNKGLSRLRGTLSLFKRANTGNRAAFQLMQDIAYGREGKLRWEIMQPLLTDPNAPPQPRIIPAVEKSRPPVYSPELRALLFSSLARPTRSLSPSKLVTPPTLPERADPNSEDARLLGPFSKRREVNIRWRYFAKGWKKTLPPLQVHVRERTADEQGILKTDAESVARAGIRPIGLQNSGVFEEAEKIAASAMPLPVPRRARIASQSEPQTPSYTTEPYLPILPPGLRLTKRFVRRRYQELMNRIPILTCSVEVPVEGKPTKPGSYSVSVSPHAITKGMRTSPDGLPIADAGDLKWIAPGGIDDIEKLKAVRTRLRAKQKDGGN